MNNIIAVPAHIDGAKVLSNRDIKITIRIENELSKEEMAEIFQYTGKYAYVLFKEYIEGGGYTEKDLGDIDLPEIKVDFDEKTPSQRLRGVLYRLWEQSEKGKPNPRTADQFYRDQMEKLLDHIKSKLE